MRLNLLKFFSYFFILSVSTDESYISTLNNSLSEFNCDPYGKFAFVIHGWGETINSGWVMDTIRNLTYHRGGCVIFMDYSVYSNNSNYFGLVSHFDNLAHLLTRKIKQATSIYDNVFLFGFSFGARLSFEAGAKIGYNLIDHIQVCDPAGPGFDREQRSVDPTLAAKYVYCINTSEKYGSHIFNCHINFRMGICGWYQVGAKKKPCGAHGLCVSYVKAQKDLEIFFNFIQFPAIFLQFSISKCFYIQQLLQLYFYPNGS